MMSLRRMHHTKQAGFTLVELLVTTAIILLLFGLVSLSLGQSQNTTAVSTSVDSMLADIKTQQLLAMAGDTGGTATTAQAHGLSIQSNKYVLFASSTYSAADANNFTVNAGQNVTLSTTFPSGQVVFVKGDGSVSGFTAGNNTITISAAGGSHVITINRFGVTTVN